MLIYPQIYPHFAQVKIFPLPRARDARIPNVQILHVQILQVGALHGIDVSNRAFVGLFCKRGLARRV